MGCLGGRGEKEGWARGSISMEVGSSSMDLPKPAGSWARLHLRKRLQVLF